MKRRTVTLSHHSPSISVPWYSGGGGWTRDLKFKQVKFTVPLTSLFDWFGISCMTTDNFCFYLQNSLIQTSQTGGQSYSDTSSFSIPWTYIEIREYWPSLPSCPCRDRHVARQIEICWRKYTLMNWETDRLIKSQRITERQTRILIVTLTDRHKDGQRGIDRQTDI